MNCSITLHVHLNIRHLLYNVAVIIGARGLNFDLKFFLHAHNMSMITAYAVVGPSYCAYGPKSSLLNNAISTKVSCARLQASRLKSDHPWCYLAETL